MYPSAKFEMKTGNKEPLFLDELLRIITIMNYYESLFVS